MENVTEPPNLRTDVRMTINVNDSPTGGKDVTATRDPERIAPVLELLGAIWRERPDWRLGQLIGNAVDTQGAEPEMSNLFYVEDDVVAAGLLAMTTRRHRINDNQARALGIDAGEPASSLRVPIPGAPADAPGPG